MGFEKGSLLMVDYTARIKDGEIFDTTRESDATAAGLDSTKKYEPMLVSVGEGWVLRGLDEALAGAEADKDIHAEVPPEKGFGEMSTSKIRVMRSRRLGDDEEKVSVGDEVQIDGKRGVIRLMASGRIKVDFNHKYAGKTLVYDARVVKVLQSDEEKISAILDRHLPDREWHRYSDGVLEVDVLGYGDSPSAKSSVRIEMFRLVPSVRKILFIETYENPALASAVEPEKPAEMDAGGSADPRLGDEKPSPEKQFDVALELSRSPSESKEQAGDGQDAEGGREQDRQADGVESWRPEDKEAEKPADDKQGQPEGEKPKQGGSEKPEDGVESWRPEDEKN